MNNLTLRVISAIFLLPIVIFPTIIGGRFFDALLILIGIIMAIEWKGITTLKTNENQIKWDLIGVLYIVIPVLCLIELRSAKNGLDAILFLFIVIWSTDIGAYFTGKTIGGPKIAPKISPKKTWSGLIGGVILAIITSRFFIDFSDFNNFATSIPAVVFLSVFSQVGDFTESALKRYFNVKDSGALIPGHGGFLDRCDGLLFAAPLFYILISLAV